ncbi:MAG: ABC transporter permease [Candidatus Binatia bacterium]|nr:ABC transporter permease [Candidatus Binatia bacterium]
MAVRVLVRHPARSSLMLLAMSIGVASVVVLTSLGESARSYVSDEFASLGTHLIMVAPGRTETSGVGPSMFAGDTPRDLTIADATAVAKSPLLGDVAPMVMGQANVSWGGRERAVSLLGATAALRRIRHWTLSQGRFLPEGDPERDSGVCVIGAKVRKELFGPRRALGEWLKVGDRRCRVTGILANKGRSIGLDVEDVVVMPVAGALTLLNRPSLNRIMANARSHEMMDRASEEIRRILKDRHQGEEDVTIVTQDALLATFDRILVALTYTVGGIAGISLLVAGILIMNVMLVSVSQRTSEIGLLKALGAPRDEILRLFLVEATTLSLAGAFMGLVIGVLGRLAILHFYPVLPLTWPIWAIVAALTTALVVGLAFGVIPARRAADLDPVAALSHH